MLRRINEIIDYSIMATDGEIGYCNDFLFEDRPWVIRYVVTKTGKWFFGRNVLLFMVALEKPDWRNQILNVNLTKQQIKKSPPLDEDAPVSRQYEKQSFLYYGWPAYWEKGTGESNRIESSLRSVKEVTEYSVCSGNEEIGNVVDFIIDEEIWTIRYLVAKIKKNHRSKKVLISMEWIASVNYLKQAVYLDLEARAIKNCPDYNPEKPITRNYESELYDHYGRPCYWASDKN